MNLYLVLALALGVAAPSVSPRVTTIAAEARVQCRHSIPLAVRRSPLTVEQQIGQRPSADSQRVESPLTGSATPRAPASGC